MDAKVGLEALGKTRLSCSCMESRHNCSVVIVIQKFNSCPLCKKLEFKILEIIILNVACYGWAT